MNRSEVDQLSLCSTFYRNVKNKYRVEWVVEYISRDMDGRAEKIGAVSRATGKSRSFSWIQLLGYSAGGAPPALEDLTEGELRSRVKRLTEINAQLERKAKSAELARMRADARYDSLRRVVCNLYDSLQNVCFSTIMDDAKSALGLVDHELGIGWRSADGKN